MGSRGKSSWRLLRQSAEGWVPVKLLALALVTLMVVGGIATVLILKTMQPPAEKKEVRALSMSVESPKIVGKSARIEIRAYDEENEPVSGADIKLLALPLRGNYVGDYKIELQVKDEGNGVYISELYSEWAGNYLLQASTEQEENIITLEKLLEYEEEELWKIDIPDWPVTPIYGRIYIDFYFADNYGNALLPDNVERIGVDSPIPVSLTVNPDNTFRISVTPENWDPVPIAISYENEIITREKVVLSWVYLEQVPSWNFKMSDLYGENNIVKVSLFVPPAKGAIQKFSMDITYDNSVLRFVDVVDANPNDGFEHFTVTTGNPITISSSSSIPANLFFDVFYVVFEPVERYHSPSTITITNPYLASIEKVPMYGSEPIYDERGNVIGYRTVVTGYTEEERPLLTLPIVENGILKPVVKIPLKIWIVEESGVTEDEVKEDIRRLQETYDRNTRECDLNFWAKFTVKINKIERGKWTSMDNAENFKEENKLNIYYVPTCTLPRRAVGRWVRGVGIFVDDGKDFDDLTLAHEMTHELSDSSVEDSPAREAQDQGGREPGNIMNYNDTGTDISSTQGDLINQHVFGQTSQGVYSP